MQNCAPFTFRGRCLRSLTVRAHSSPASAKKVAPGKHNGVGSTERIFAFVSSTPDETKEAFRNWAVKHNGCICCREEGASAFRWNCLFKVPSAVFKLCFSDNLTFFKAYDASEIFISERVKKVQAKIQNTQKRSVADLDIDSWAISWLHLSPGPPTNIQLLQFYNRYHNNSATPTWPIAALNNLPCLTY